MSSPSKPLPRVKPFMKIPSWYINSTPIPSSLGSAIYSIFDSVSNSFLILSLNKDSSPLSIAFERESIGVRCATVSNPASGFAPTL